MWRIGKQVAGRGFPLNTTGTVSLAAWRTAQRRSVNSAFRRTVFALAPIYRALLPHVTFIGVTGSCGKTTTKELIAAVLSAQLRGQASIGNHNSPGYLARTILSVRPWDRFCVLEMALNSSGGTLDGPLWLVRPRIGVVTNVGTDHLSAFHSIETIAAEKSKVIAVLPANGTAVLNADDARVRAMQAQCAGRVITCGVAPDALLRAESISASWPDRLSFIIRYDGQSHRVCTQLYGEHLVPCVLAAVAVGLAMGVPIHTSVQAINAVAPYEHRMKPVNRSDGVTFIQDDAKAPLWSIPATFHFMKEARARRKIIVIGSLSDYAGNSDRTYVSVARQALDVADRVVFVGSRAVKCLKARRHSGDDSLHAFYSAESAAEELRGWLRSGDLVLLKGSERDHLGMIVDARPPQNATQTGPAPRHTSESLQFAQVIVGLGNPGAQYEHTPHNVGYRVLDQLARSLAGEWDRDHQAMVAHIKLPGRSIALVKPLTYVNASGPALSQLGKRHAFSTADCVLVHDDLDLPLGAVRICERGSDGGHRGVRSIFDSFQTDEIRRVRIGVGQPGEKAHPSSYVLTPFSPSQAPVIERSCAEAADWLRRLLTDPAVR